MTIAGFDRLGRRWAARYIPEIGIVEWRLQATALRDASEGEGMLPEALQHPWEWCYNDWPREP